MLYFDNSATTQPYPELLATYTKIATDYFANPSSIHELGSKSKKLLEAAREQVAQILAFESNEIYFTASGTEANNWLFHSVVSEAVKMRPHAKRILISAIEHPSVSEQVHQLEARGFIVEWIAVNQKGIIDLERLKQQLDSQVLLISTMAVNNEMGAIQPLAQIAALLTAFPQIIWHVDAVQAVTTQLSSLQIKRIDALSVSGHKFHAGRGTGILALRKRVVVAPFMIGGGQEKGLRSGTENLASIVVTAKALRLAKEKQESTKKLLQVNKAMLVTAFQKAGWQIFSGEQTSAHILCVAYPTIPGEVLVHAFEQVGVMVSTTSACSSRKHQTHHTLKAMGVNDQISKSAIRLSMSSLTTQAETQVVCDLIATVTQQFNK